EAGTVLGWSGSELVLWGVDGAILATLPQPSTPVRNSGAFGYPTVQRNNLGEVVAIADPTGGILFYDPNTNEWTDITASIRGLGTGVFDSIQEFNDRRQFVGLAVPPENQFGTF